MKITQKTIVYLSLILIISILAFTAPIKAVKAEGDYTFYVLNDDYSSFNRGNWSNYSEKFLVDGQPPYYQDTINVSSAIIFDNDYTTKASNYEGARLVNNVRFCKNPNNVDVHTVFETNFTVFLNNKDNRRKDISFGVLFGLNQKDSSLASAGYFEFDSFTFRLKYKGEELTPEYLTERQRSDFNGYIEYDCKLTVKLVATSDGVLTLSYVFPPDGTSISQPYCKYTGLDFDGYFGIMGTSYESSHKDFSVTFDGVRLNGTTKIDNNFSVLSTTIEKEKLAIAVVSEKPIPLEAKVVTNPNLEEYHVVKYKVLSGDAVVEGNQLRVTGAGEITVRAYSLYDQTKYEDFTFVATDLKIDSIEFISDFENIDVNAQPIRLSAITNSNSYVAEHNEVKFEVIEGNAEIFCDKYLKILGKGTVTIRASSVYFSNKYVDKSFTVTDEEEKYLPLCEQPEDMKNSAGGCSGQMHAGYIYLLFILTSIIILRRSNKYGKKQRDKKNII